MIGNSDKAAGMANQAESKIKQDERTLALLSDRLIRSRSPETPAPPVRS
jgi:hypothetical protein